MLGFRISQTDIFHSYQLASRLSERLDEMGKDLTDMIEEINDASSTLNKHSKADDPVSPNYHIIEADLPIYFYQIALASRQSTQQPSGSTTADRSRYSCFAA